MHWRQPKTRWWLMIELHLSCFSFFSLCHNRRRPRCCLWWSRRKWRETTATWTSRWRSTSGLSVACLLVSAAPDMFKSRLHWFFTSMWLLVLQKMHNMKITKRLWTRTFQNLMSCFFQTSSWHNEREIIIYTNRLFDRLPHVFKWQMYTNNGSIGEEQ